jgi:hypothetical protein
MQHQSKREIMTTDNARSGFALIPVIGALAVLLLSFGCGDDDPGPTQSDPPENEFSNNLTFTRQGGATMSSGSEIAICCGIWEPGHIDDNTLKILWGDSTAAWKLFILVDEVSAGTTYDLATIGAAPVQMFIADFSDGNELNSDQSESTGTITINSFSCGPPVTLDVTINATIDSEFHDGPSVTVTGTFTCTVHSNPAPFGCDFSL